jgi:hypothetical protein
VRQHALLKTRQPVFVPKGDDCFSVLFIPEAKLTGRIVAGSGGPCEVQKFLSGDSLEHLCGHFGNDDPLTVCRRCAARFYQPS